MNAIPAFITSLSMVYNNRLIELGVQCLNDVFWGATIEQFRISHYLPLAGPVFMLPKSFDAFTDAVEEEMFYFS
jgi:hypothetical protein